MSGGFVTWTHREPPLDACAVAAFGDVARLLAKRLAASSDEILGKLTGVAGKNVIVLLGETSDLPWIDGVVYLGRDELAPSLLLPTHQKPVVPPANLLDRAVTARFPKHAAPIAILPDELTLVSCHDAMRLSRQRITAWLEEVKR